MSEPGDDEANEEYLVLRNGKGQYSLWSPANDIPAGWEAVGFSGSKQACMSYVDQHWTDMLRPGTAACA